MVVTGECDDVPLKPKTRLEWATLPALAYGSLGTIWWYIVSVLIIKLSLREGSRSAQDKKVGSPMTIWAADLDGSPKLDGLCL